MNTYAPSIYEYRSAADFEQAMREWCDENEPQHIIDGKAITKPYIEAHRPACGLKVTKRYCSPLSRPAGCRADHLDGGSASDYRAAGYHRF